MKTPRISVASAASLMRVDGFVLMWNLTQSEYRICTDPDWGTAVAYLTLKDAATLKANFKGCLESKLDTMFEISTFKADLR